MTRAVTGPAALGAETGALLAALQLLASDAPAEHLDLLHRLAAGSSEPDAELVRQGVVLARQVQQRISAARARESDATTLLAAARRISALRSGDAIARTVATVARELLDVDVACVRFRPGNVAGTSSAVGLRIPLAADDETEHHIGLGISGDEALGLQWSSDFNADDRVAHDSTVARVIAREGLRGVLAAPLVRGGVLLGSLYVGDRRFRHFSPADLDTVRAVAELAAGALDHAHALTLARTALRKRTRLDGERERERRALQDRLRIRAELVELVVSGASLQDLLDRASADVGTAVGLADRSGSILAASTTDPDRPDALRDGTCVAPASARSMCFGAVVVAADTGLDERRIDVLRLVGRLAAIMLALRSGTGEGDGPFRTGVLDELLRAFGAKPNGGMPSSASDAPNDAPLGVDRLTREVLEHRVRRIGLEVDLPFVVVVARVPERLARARLWASAFADRRKGLHTVIDNDIVLLLPGDDPSTAAHQVAAAITEQVGPDVRVGAGGPGLPVRDVATMLHEAQRCLQAVGALGVTVGTAAAPDDLGFVGLLLSERRDPDAFIRTVIGRLLDHDRERDTDLVATAETWFAVGGSPARAAQRLHVHANTVSRRVQKITGLLGPEWNTADGAVDLQVALRLLRARPGGTDGL